MKNLAKAVLAVMDDAKLKVREYLVNKYNELKLFIGHQHLPLTVTAIFSADFEKQNFNNR